MINLKELEKIGDNQSIRDILFQELRFNPSNLEILDFLLKYMDDYQNLHKYGKYYIDLLFELQDYFPENYKAQLCVLEARLLYEHNDPQVVWETLAKGLIYFPSSDEILNEIESIFSHSDAPEVTDYMESIGELVAKKEFPKDSFEYLLLIFDDPEYPEQFDLAKKKALGCTS